MDAFFASVEQLDNPDLRGKPVLVGARSRRGVVTAASYEARPTGVGSAMSMVEALRRCPEAIVVPPRRARYSELSGKVFEVFRRYTPLVEGLSVDEAFLDVTGSRALFGDGPEIARRIKQDVLSEIGLTGSAGVAPNKFVAKIASDLEKPDGLTVVPPDGASAFLAPLPLERMWRVGPKARVKLRAAGMQTIGDLARADTHTLEQLLGSWGPVARELVRPHHDRRAPQADLATVDAGGRPSRRQGTLGAGGHAQDQVRRSSHSHASSSTLPGSRGHGCDLRDGPRSPRSIRCARHWRAAHGGFGFRVDQASRCRAFPRRGAGAARALGSDDACVARTVRSCRGDARFLDR